MSNEEDLKGKDKRALRALGHALKPVVYMGKEGLSEGVVEATLQALEDHELIKIKCGTNHLGDTKVVANELAKKTDSILAQVIGNSILLYKEHPKNPVIVLPRDK